MNEKSKTIVTIAAWIALLVYILYFIYGIVAIYKGWYLLEFYVLNREILVTIEKYFYTLYIVFLILCIFLIIWKSCNKRKCGESHSIISDELEMGVKDINKSKQRGEKTDRK